MTPIGGPLDKRKKLLLGGGAALAALALYMKAKNGAAGTTTSTSSQPQAMYDSTAADAARYADQQDSALQGQFSDQLSAAQSQISKQAGEISYLASQRAKIVNRIVSDEKKQAAAPPKVANSPAKNQKPAWAGAKLPLGKP